MKEVAMSNSSTRDANPFEEEEIEDISDSTIPSIVKLEDPASIGSCTEDSPESSKAVRANKISISVTPDNKPQRFSPKSSPKKMILIALAVLSAVIFVVAMLVVFLGRGKQEDSRCEWPDLSGCPGSGISLQDVGLTGTIPTSIGLWTRLKSIQLNGNLLSGKVPTEIGLLTALTNLDLSYNSLTGSIPSEMRFLTSLKSVFFTKNNLSGTIPMELSELTNMKMLGLSLNEFNGEISSDFCSLDDIAISIDCDEVVCPCCANGAGISCRLTHLIQSHGLNNTFQNATSPQALALDWLVHDPYTSSLQEDARILQRYALATIWYSTNGRTGWNHQWLESVDECLWHEQDFHKCTAKGLVTDLYLASDGLSGSMPTEISLMTELGWVSWQNNSLTGTLPPEIGKLTALYFLDLHLNSFSGTVPSELGELTRLEWLNLRSNSLSGSIPSWLGLLTKLTMLGLHSNQFTGSVPSEIGQLTELLYLYLQNNDDLTGTIPAALCDLLNVHIKINEGGIDCPCCESGND